MEVGGRLVVDSASFTVMPRDKVGIVGRNGAGKTSLFKVLGGASEPKAGRVVRKGGFGYLPQDPKIDTALDGRSCVTHVLSGRGIDDEMVRIEKLRIAMEETPDERNVSRYLERRGVVPDQRRLRGRERGPGDGRRPRHPRCPARPADQHAVGRSATARRTRPHPVRRLRRALPRRADQPPRRRRQGLADELPAPVQGRAARDQPRPRAARRIDHPRAPPRPSDRERRSAR